MAKIFTVVDAATQSKVSFETEATTVGELLAELDARNISYNGKTLYEGLTKSEFNVTKKDGILPHDVEYKGATTNNLVFMLTTPNKKISSGMDRKEAYDKVKTLNLGDAIKAKFGRNFTQVTTVDLVSFVLTNMGTTEEAPNDEEPEVPHSLHLEMLTFIVHLVKEGYVPFEVLMKGLEAEGVITFTAHAGSDSDVDKERMQKKAKPAQTECPYDEDAIAEMF